LISPNLWWTLLQSLLPPASLQTLLLQAQTRRKISPQSSHPLLHHLHQPFHHRILHQLLSFSPLLLLPVQLQQIIR
jgi:hypothetical protein